MWWKLNIKYVVEMKFVVQIQIRYVDVVHAKHVVEIKYLVQIKDELWSPAAEMEYCASAASMLAEEIWQIAEGYVEVPVTLLA